MTEDEAKTKWCPFVRLTGTEQEWHANRPQGASAPSERSTYLCMASACMAWRVQRDVATETRRSSQRPAGDGWLPGEVYDDWTRTRAVVLGGYCGLAGAPQ